MSSVRVKGMGRYVPVRNMSHRERAATPLPFARYLVAEVAARWPNCRVAVLWCQRGTVYHRLVPLVQVWGITMDAMRYDGPYPVVCHPPCGPWGKYRAVSRQSKRHGIRAVELVHRWGGVVEQPLGSQLFRLHGRGGTVTVCDQGDYGHRGQKRTILYWGT